MKRLGGGSHQRMSGLRKGIVIRDVFMQGLLMIKEVEQKKINKTR